MIDFKLHNAIKNQPDFAGFLQNLLKHLGVTNNDKLSYGKKIVLMLCSGCLTSVVTILFVVIYVKRDNSETLFEAISIVTFLGLGLLKLKSLWHGRETWIYLINTTTVIQNQQLSIDHSYEEYETDDEELEKDSTHDCIKNYTRRLIKTTLIILAVYCITTVTFCVAPFIQYGFKKIYGSEVVEMPYILPGWSFLNEMGLVGYTIDVFIQCIASWYCVFIHISFDILIVSLMIFTSGQYSILRACSERIGGRGRNLMPTRERDCRARGRIRKCHTMHMNLTKFITTMSNHTAIFFGFYFLVAAMTLCSITFRLKIVKKTEHLTVLQIISLLQYMSANLVQLFIFCYYGDEVSNQSAVKPGEGPFGASYWCLSPKVRKELILLYVGMMRAQRLAAGPFQYLHLSSFIQIVRTAYSYYAVLRE